MYIIVMFDKDGDKSICYGADGRNPGLYMSYEEAKKERDWMRIQYKDYPEEPKYFIFELSEVL